MFILLIAIFFLVLYICGSRQYSYWSDRNVAHNKPIPYFGNNFWNYVQVKSRSQVAIELYKQFPQERVVGYYRGLTPELLIRDPDIIRSILTVDFNHFHARGLGRNPKVEPMLENLFHADGDAWKLLRQRLTPAFTSGKLRNMFPLIVECAEGLRELAEEKSVSGEPYDVREMMARFTTDFIGACGFGIKMNSINDSSSKFRELGKTIFTIPFSAALKAFLKELSPHYLRHLKPVGTAVEDSIIEILNGILEQRNYKPIGRNDFIDLLIDLKNQGTISAESIEHFDDNGKGKIVTREMDIKLMAAQMFIFFAAGFETSSSATSYTLHQLAHNPYVQERVQREVDDVLVKYGNTICYDAVKEMSHLQRTFNEALRKFPSLGVLNRVCTKKYRVPDTDLWLDKGVRIAIPVSAIHNDEKYFEEPEKFDPDRFLPDVSQHRHKYVYLPFGEGPRACIGTRLGMMQSIAGLAALLQRFTFEPVPLGSDISGNQVRIDPTSNTVQSILGGLPLVVKKRRL